MRLDDGQPVLQFDAAGAVAVAVQLQNGDDGVFRLPWRPMFRSPGCLAGGGAATPIWLCTIGPVGCAPGFFRRLWLAGLARPGEPDHFAPPPKTQVECLGLRLWCACRSEHFAPPVGETPSPREGGLRWMARRGSPGAGGRPSAGSSRSRGAQTAPPAAGAGHQAALGACRLGCRVPQLTDRQLGTALQGAGGRLEGGRLHGGLGL